MPEKRLDQFFARRLVLATGWSMIAGLAGGAFIELWGRWDAAPPTVAAYSILFVLGLAAGIVSTWYLAQVPEPRMPQSPPHIDLRQMMTAPFGDPNFRRLIFFMSSWNFAVNLAAPFFVVYLLQELGFSMGLVVILSVISQCANVLMLQIWGRLSDRFSNKSVLSVAAPLFLLCILGWTLLPTGHAATAPLLVLLHIAMGLAAAGVGLASGNIGLKLAPRGSATAYLAANALLGSLFAGIAPILGGYFADDFSARELSVIIRWSAEGSVAEFVTVQIRHWDFFFLLAFVLGLFSLHRLSLVREEREVDEGVMVQELLMEARRSVRNLSSVAGLRTGAWFPFGRAVDAPPPAQQELDLR